MACIVLDILAQRRQRQTNSWGLLASQSSLFGEFQEKEICQKQKKVDSTHAHIHPDT